MEDVYICSAYRTPIGKINGEYSKISSIKLGSAVLSKCIDQIGLGADQISQVVIGQVFTAGLGQNPARQTAVLAKVPPEVPAYSINMLEGSSLKAIYDAYTSIRAGDCSIVFAGGQENMTLACHSANLRMNDVIGHIQWKDTAVTDGLSDAFLGLQMGEIADHLSNAYMVSRALQDKFSLMSHTRAVKAIDNGYFHNELVLLGEENLLIDEIPSRNCSLEQLANLPTLFCPKNASVTIGNSACMSDGAAGVLLAPQSEVTKRSLFPQARIVAISQVGCEPIEMGRASIASIQNVVDKANWSMNSIDLFEIDETFAVYAMLCVDTLDLELEKVNISGGAIAFGHPIGASGARIVVTLVHNLKRLNKKRGVASMCVGGGMGIAIAVERNKFW